MRKIRILNKNYQDLGIHTPLKELAGYSLYNVFAENKAVPFLSNEQVDYWEDVYNAFLGIKDNDLVYKEYGKSIQDVAWKNVYLGKNLIVPDWHPDFLDWYDVDTGEFFINEPYVDMYEFSSLNLSVNKTYIITLEITQEGSFSSPDVFAGIRGLDADDELVFEMFHNTGKHTRTITGVTRLVIDRRGVNYTVNEPMRFKVQVEEGSQATSFDIPYVEGYSKIELRYSDLFESGFLIKKTKNLGKPELEGKEYLGDGWYQLVLNAQVDFKYNVFSGFYELSLDDYRGTIYDFFVFKDNRTYTLSYYYETIESMTQITILSLNNVGKYNWLPLYNSDYQNNKQETKSDVVDGDILRLATATNNLTFNKLVFRFQLEEGSVATDYEVPYIEGFSPSRPWFDDWDIQGLQPQPTIEQINKMYRFYETYKNTRVLPTVYTVINPIGFGTHYDFKEFNDLIYSHDVKYEDMSLELLFGVGYNAYKGFNIMQDFIKDNELVIEYDFGEGIRYVDVRLINAPKTEKDTTKLLRSVFMFKRLTPFYELLKEKGYDWIPFEPKHLPFKNETNHDIGIVFYGSHWTDEDWAGFTVKIDGIEKQVSINTSVGFTSFYYDSLNKEMILNSNYHAYEFINWNYTDNPFIVLKPNETLEEVSSSMYEWEFIIKKWVND